MGFDLRNGEYRYKRKLGESCFIVNLYLHVPTGEEVAIKHIPLDPKATEADLKPIRDEVFFHQKLSTHPNVTKIIDCFLDGGKNG